MLNLPNLCINTQTVSMNDEIGENESFEVEASANVTSLCLHSKHKGHMNFSPFLCSLHIN